MRFLTKKILLLLLISVCLCPLALAGVSGISTTFLKRRELRQANSWSSKPLSVQKAVSNLLRYDAIWFAEGISRYNRPAWDYLRQHHPKVLTLFYISSDSTYDTNDRFCFCFDYGYINTYHPEWFLLNNTQDSDKADHKNSDNRIRWDNKSKKSAYYNRFYLDIVSKDFQEWAAEQILEWVSGEKQGLRYPYDGCAMDNVNIGSRRMKQITRRHPNWKYANNLKAWNEGFFEYLKTVKAKLNKHGYILVVNHTLDYSSNAESDYWEVFPECVDGIMDENSLRYSRQPYYYNKTWLSSIEKHERILRKGLIDWWVSYPPESEPGGYEKFMYTYCSWLLIKQPGKSLYHARKLASQGENTSEPIWYEEYDLPIGEPVGTRYKQNNCYMRNYKNAKVVVNPTGKLQKIVIDEKKLWLDWVSKQRVSTLELQTKTGRILLPINYQLKKSGDRVK
jgi:hypothetical protein